MEAQQAINRAATPTIDVVRAIAPQQFDNPTPCAHYRVRGLINHLLFWAPSLTGAARKQAVAPPAANDLEIDLTDDDAPSRLAATLAQVAEAWSEPEAWQGDTYFAGPDPLPAATVGGMACTELVIHGWDLACATGRPASWDAGVVDFIHRELAVTAGQGRQLGVYGPEVEVDAARSTLERALGLSGRDPDWSQPNP